MTRALLTVAIALAGFVSCASAEPQDIIDNAFAQQSQGATLAQVRVALEPHAGGDDAIDFALGAVDFLLSGETLLQRVHTHGFLSTFRGVAPLAPQGRFVTWFGNDTPEPTGPADVHAAVLEWTQKLDQADRTLSAVGGDFTCKLSLPDLRFDINGDGEATSAERLGALFDLLPPRWQRDPDTGQGEMTSLVPEELTVAFDRGDAEWLRGYCHVLMAVGEWMLAHNGKDLFDHTGHVFFPDAKITFDYLPGSTWSLERISGGSMRTPAPFDFTDLFAFFANMRLPVDEPDRMHTALKHLRAAVVHGKAMWAHYDAETDNNLEWIPNPQQTAAFHEVQVDALMRDGWLLFLDEADAILAGKKVLRFWRGDGTRGIDVPKVFLDPHEFDLVYWVQGSAAAPYLREGEFTTPGTWARLRKAFDNRMLRYSFWFN